MALAGAPRVCQKLCVKDGGHSCWKRGECRWSFPLHQLCEAKTTPAERPALHGQGAQAQGLSNVGLIWKASFLKFGFPCSIFDRLISDYSSPISVQITSWHCTRRNDWLLFYPLLKGHFHEIFLKNEFAHSSVSPLSLIIAFFAFA